MKAWLVIFVCCGTLLLNQDLCALGEVPQNEIVKIGEDLFVAPGEEVMNALVIGGDAYVQGAVRQDVVALGGSIFLGPRSRVDGDVTAVGGSIVKQDGARVGGDLSTVQTPDLGPLVKRLSRSEMPMIMPHVLHYSGVMQFIGLLFLGIVLAAVLPGTVSHVSSIVEHHLLRVVFWGVLALLLIVPVGLMLLISLVGIVLIPLEVIFIICCGLLGYVAAAHLVGRKIRRALKLSEKSVMLETVLGLVVLFLVSWVPFLGWFVLAILVFLGFGGVMAAMMMRRGPVSRTG
ncbi:MAG: hypothetical protein ABFD81_10075 [Syntrophaceae bacterium]